MGKTKDSFMQQREQEQEESNTRNKPLQASPSQALSNTFKSLKTIDAATIDTLAKAQVEEVLEGHIEAAEMYSLAVKGLAYFNTLVENLKPLVYAKTYATKGDSYVINGVKLSPAELGTKYDYQSAEDPNWDRLNEAFERIKHAKETREKYLKTLTTKQTMVDEESGEVYTILPPVKTSTQGYTSKIQ